MSRQYQINKVWPAPIQGLTTELPVELLPDMQSPDLVNVYHDGGFVKKTLGFAKTHTNALSLGGETATIGKIYQFIKPDGTLLQVAEAKISTQKYVVYSTSLTGDWNTNPVIAGMDATAEINFTTFGAWLVFGNGVAGAANSNVMWDGTLSSGTPTRVYRLGIAAPTNALGAPTKSSGALGATFFYTYTYTNSVSGIESNPILTGVGGASGLSVTYSTQQGSFAFPTTSAVALEGVDYWTLYRTVAGGATTGPYFKVGTATIASAIADNTADSALGAQLELDHDLLPNCGVFRNWRNRIWAGKDPGAKSTVYYSRVDKVAYFPGASALMGDPLGEKNFDNVELNDGEHLTGIGDVGNILVVTKERSIHPYIATSGNSFQKLGAIRRHGCSNHRSIIQKNGLYMADNNGIWFYDGQTSIELTSRVRTTFKNMSAAGKAKFHSVWYEPMSFYIMFYQQAGASNTNAAMILDPRSGRPDPRNIGIFTLRTLKANGSGLVVNSDGTPQILLGDTAGYAYQLFKAATYTFDAVAYDSYFKTKFFQIDPHGLYRYRNGLLTVLSDGNWQATISYILDFGRTVGGSAYVELAPSGLTFTWSGFTWTGFTWTISGIAVTDTAYEMDGESKSIQWTFANNTSTQNFSVSKIGVRAQFKKAA